MLVKCKRCGYEWEYKGTSEWYISCARCKTTISIRKVKEEHRKTKRKKDVIKSQKGENKEHQSSIRNSNTPSLTLSIVRGV